MEVYYLLSSFSPAGVGGCDVYRWNDGAPEKTGSYFPEISAGTTYFDTARSVLYATDERMFTDETPDGGGRIWALRLDPETGALSELNHLPAGGPAPSYCSTDSTEKYLVVTCFGDVKSAPPAKPGEPPRRSPGETCVSLFRLNADGSIGEMADCYRFEPELRGETQLKGHAHCVKRSPDGSFFIVNEMGMDRLCTFRIDYATEKLLCSEYRCKPGSGPRYSAFHPSEPWLFVNFEDEPCVGSYSYDKNGSLTRLSMVSVLGSTVPEKGDNQSGFAIHPNGKYLYSALRGKDVVTVLSVDKAGTLSVLQQVKCRGSRLKDCAVSPDGAYLSVAARGNNTAEIFRIAADGTLQETDVCLEKNAAGYSTFLTV